MSDQKAKVKMKQGMMAVYKCSVKNLRDSARKIVALRSDILKQLKKEMDIQVLGTIKPEGILWVHYKAQIDAGMVVAGADAVPADALLGAMSPELTVGQRRSKAMQAGKARKKAEREEAARLLAEKEARDAEADNEAVQVESGSEPQTSGDGSESETEEVGVDEAGAVGPESTVAGELTKEDVEQMAMDELLASEKQ
jgi:hypothetical protein